MASERKTFNEINITPLTDIFLVLLIIMMVIAPMLDKQGLNLAVPNTVEVQEEIKDSKIIRITVSDEDKYYYEGEEVQASDLKELITGLKAENPDGLLIMTQPDATHGAVVKLMDEAQNSGVTSISLAEEF